MHLVNNIYINYLLPELFTEEVNIKASLFLTPELMIPFIQRLHIIHEKHIMSKSSSINEITT